MKLKCLSLSPSAPCSVPIIQPSSLPLHELHLFAGGGGGILGGMLAGHTPCCAVEINPFCRKILLQRQRDGILPWFPVWDDVRTFDGTEWKGRADVVSGGFPCQDISAAGKGAGIDGEKSSLWREMARIVGEVRPRFVFVENSPLLVQRGLAVVLGDLASMGYHARWGVLGANAAGLPHRRERLWLLAADPERSEWREQQHDGASGRMGRKLEPVAWDRDWLSVLTRVRGACDGLARNVDRTDAIRNGQVPAVARLAWELLKSMES